MNSKTRWARNLQRVMRVQQNIFLTWKRLYLTAFLKFKATCRNVMLFCWKASITSRRTSSNTHNSACTSTGAHRERQIPPLRCVKRQKERGERGKMIF